MPLSRSAVALAGLLLPAAAMAADIPGNSGTQARLTQGNPKSSDLDGLKDRDWFRVNLTGGQQYAFRNSGAGSRLLDRNLRVLGHDAGSLDEDTGFEAEAPYTGLYFLDVNGPQSPDDPPDNKYGYTVRYNTDCASDNTTACSLTLGKPQQRIITFFGDADWFKVKLDRGKTYAVKLDDDFRYAAEILDVNGNVLRTDASGPIRDFRPPRSGAYFIAVFADEDIRGDLYKVELLLDSQLPGHP